MDLRGKVLICITDKYGNFTKGKLYPIDVWAVNKHDPGNYSARITDDEHDYYGVNVYRKEFNEMFIVVDDYNVLARQLEACWIPVEERLPEELQVVLVHGTGENLIKKGYECAWLIDGRWTCWFTKDITHWMPLPAPPKGVE